MKYKIAYIFFIALFILNIILAGPEWIPSWESVLRIVLIISMILMPIAGFLIILHIRKYVNAKDLHWFYKAIAIIGIPLIWLTSAFFSSLTFGQGFLGATHYKTHNFSEYGITIYLYDSSFLDPSTTIKVHDGLLPTMRNLHTFGRRPEDISISQNGKTVSISDGDWILEYNLETHFLTK